MRSGLVLATLLAAFAGAARAQQCLSYSDGLGNTTLTCPDGRSGYLYTPPGSVPQGLFGGQPYTGVPANLTPPFARPGLPSATYVDQPPPAFALPPPPPAPSDPPPFAVLTPQPELTPLQRAYQEQRLAEASRRRAAERAAKAAAAEPPAGRLPQDR